MLSFWSEKEGSMARGVTGSYRSFLMKVAGFKLSPGWLFRNNLVS